MGSKRYKLLEISSSGCANCVTMSGVISQIAAGREDFEAESKDVTQFDEATLKAWEVTQAPVLLLLDQNVVIGRVFGYQIPEILELWIDSRIK